MNSNELETTIQSSDVIISRSGYTTIMDLATLEKKAFFIPTPGQNEQYILAKILETWHIAPFCKQNAFNLKVLEKIGAYKGFQSFNNNPDYKKLFGLFERE
jgi:UDP-N-acetylglucosamine:LPS N-acetylglucosamine transferase